MGGGSGGGLRAKSRELCRWRLGVGAETVRPQIGREERVMGMAEE